MVRERKPYVTLTTQEGPDQVYLEGVHNEDYELPYSLRSH